MIWKPGRLGGFHQLDLLDEGAAGAPRSVRSVQDGADHRRLGDAGPKAEFFHFGYPLVN